jgi:N-acetylneuraminic acid mutarotase
VNNRGYVGLGQDNSNNQLSDMWEFRDPSNSTPTLTTNSVSGIGISTTTSGGEIQNDGGYSITAKGVCWNTTGSPTISDDYSEDGTGYASFTSDITNLQPNTTYYVRAYATNEIGTSYGSEVSFRTEEIANTIKYSSIAKNSSGVVQSNTYISVKVSIMNSGRTTVYSESQTVYTDTYGNYSINIGKGDILNGDFSSIDVASEDYTLEIETDVSAPFSDYILVEKRKLISLLAQTASSSPATFKSGDIVPFIDLADRPGWTYTGKSECLGSIDTWTAISNSNTPSGRRHCPAVWTGKQILIWGGVNQTEVLTDGKIYDYATDTWINISSINEPSARAYHTAIWTGSEMLLWGGSDFSNNTFNSGARYNPTTDTWFEISTTNAPSARSNHTMIWTGSKVIVWGGINGTTFLNDGGLYDPTTNTWETISSINAPIARYGHSAVWTGSNMIIWGGFINNIVEATNTGAEYNPIDDTWITISTTNAPTARSVPAAVWTGKEMIIWGGHNNTSIEQNTGGKYYPESDTWISTSTTNAPSARVYSTCNWTGKEMIIWGGRDVSNNIINTGGMYNPNQDSWSSITTTNAPTARISFWISPGVWTGQEFIIWGGYNTSSIHYTDGSKLGTVLSIYWYKKD